MSEDLKLAERVVHGMVERDAFSRWLGIEVLEIAPRHSAVQMQVRQEMVNGFGVAHGGIAYAVADSALAFAANTHGKVTVAIENGISYPRAIQVGDVITATADEDAASNKLGYYRVIVRNQKEEIVATFRGTVYRTEKSHAAL